MCHFPLLGSEIYLYWHWHWLWLLAASWNVEYHCAGYWSSRAAEGLYKCTYQGEEQTDEGEPASAVLDQDGNVENLYGVTLEDLQWRLIFHCPLLTLQHRHTRYQCIIWEPKVWGVKRYRDPERIGDGSDSSESCALC